VDSDGTVAVCESHPVGKTHSSGVAILDSAGASKRYFSTGQYFVEHLAFAPDHSLWNFGWERAPGGGEVRADYMMLRKYSVDGRQLGAYFPRSLYPRGLPPAGSTVGTFRLLMAKDRIGLMAVSGKRSENPEWVECLYHCAIIPEIKALTDAKRTPARSSGSILPPQRASKNTEPMRFSPSF
jgi:hypothetical protein